MKYCSKCGNACEDNMSFCNKCGTPLGAPASAPVAETPAVAEPVVSPTDHTAEFDPADISENKVLAMTAYLMGAIGIIICLLAINNSKYVAFHVKQALKISVVLVLCTVLCAIPILGWIAFGVIATIALVITIIGFVNVCKGQAKELPIIKNLKFLK